MAWLVSLSVALIVAALATVTAGVIANACVAWYHIPSREGAAGFFVVFIGLSGGVVGGLLGLISARLTASYWGGGFFPELACASAAMLLVAGTAAIACRWLADVPPELDGQQLNLEIEFRLPAQIFSDAQIALAHEWTMELGSISGHTRRAYETGQLHVDSLQAAGGHWILPASVFLFTERGSRAINLRSASEDLAGFLLPLPSRPGRAFESWSEWLPRQQADGSPWPDQKISYRFRIRRIAAETSNLH